MPNCILLRIKPLFHHHISCCCALLYWGLISTDFKYLPGSYGNLKPTRHNAFVLMDEMKWVSFVLTPHRFQSIWPISCLSLFGWCLTNPFHQAPCTVSPRPRKSLWLIALAWLWWVHCCFAAFHKWAPCSCSSEISCVFGAACWEDWWCPTSDDHCPPYWCRNQSARALKAYTCLIFCPESPRYGHKNNNFWSSLWWQSVPIKIYINLTLKKCNFLMTNKVKIIDCL